MRNYTFVAHIKTGRTAVRHHITIEAQSPTEAIVEAKQHVEGFLKELDATPHDLEAFSLTGSYPA